jgi:chaperonin cofactor prefoldin
MFPRKTIIIFFLLIQVSLQSQTWQEFVVQDAKDTIATGMPIAVGAAALWYFANRIPHEWENLAHPSSEFIYKTWEDQGFLKSRKVLLKRIPSNSILAKIVVYTQELPGALAVGEPFIKRIESLLKQQTLFINKLQEHPEQEKKLMQKLGEVEDGLDECRFVCGHERVHKECHHTYQLLITQFTAPFIVYSYFKHTRMFIQKKYSLPLVEWTLRRSVSRSGAEVFIGWLRAQSIEYSADIHASDDPKILRAGLRLFKRALDNRSVKRSRVQPHLTESIMGWVFRYTHPTLGNRIHYLTKHIEKLEKKIKERRELLVVDEEIQN